ncbi:MAG TPA: hypothetical protein VJM06_00825 [Gaiellaceae bacterium]|nr:hypothetical protein [Gaiellaceae bacterium]
MTKRTRALAPLLAVTALLVSCGGESGALHATLTDDDCIFEGTTTARAGRLSIEVENTTFRFGSFGVVALYDGESIDDIELVRERVESRRLLRNRARSDVPPPFGRWVAGADVEPTTRTFLPVDADAGRYAIVCYVHRNADDRRRTGEIARPERAFVAGQIEVAGTPSSS